MTPDKLLNDTLAQSDEEEVFAAFLAGRQADPEAVRRVHERAMQIRENTFRRHGLLDIAVPYIRELRGELPE